MPIANLTPAQKTIVQQCLRIAAERPDLFPDWEFQTIFGVTRKEMSSVAAQWPALDESDGIVRCAINNAMNNLLGYPHQHQDDWDEHFPFSVQALMETFRAWRGDRPRGYVEPME